MPNPVEVGDRASGTGRFSSWMGSGSLTKRASLTSLASSLDHIAGLGVQFVINPLLVHGLGSYLYGVWRVLYSLNGYLWAASGRSAQVLTWVVANGQRTLSDEQKRRYVGSAVVVWFIFLPVLALVGGLGAWFAPVILETPQEYVWGVRAAAALLAADAIALTLLSIPRSALQGENLGYKRMGSSAILIVVGGVFMLIAIRLDAGIAGVALANVLGTVATGLLFLRVARTHVGWFGVERPSRKDVRWFLGLSGWFTAWKFVYEILTAGDVIVLAIFGRVELVTVYTLTKFVSQALVPLIAVVFEGSSPGLGAIIGGGDHPKGIRLRNELMALSWLLCTGLGAALLIWNRSFVGLWVGPEFYAGADVMLLIVVMIMQFVFIGNDARIIDLTLKVRAKVVLGAASAGLSLALAAIFVVVFEDQILGMCAGIIVGRTMLSVAYPSLIGRLLGHPIAGQLRAVPRPVSVTVIVFSAAMLLGTRWSTGSWVALATFGAATALAASVLAGALGLTGAQRRALLARLAHLTGRGRGPGAPGGRAREVAP